MDPGFVALAVFLRLHGVGGGPEQIRRLCGTARIGVAEMLRCAGQLGLKVCSRTTSWKRLAGTPLPGIAALRTGGFLLLGKIAEDSALVVSTSSPQPEFMTRAEFEAVWDGRLVLVKRRKSLSDFVHRFLRVFDQADVQTRGLAIAGILARGLAHGAVLGHSLAQRLRLVRARRSLPAHDGGVVPATPEIHGAKSVIPWLDA